METKKMITAWLTAGTDAAPEFVKCELVTNEKNLRVVKTLEAGGGFAKGAEVAMGGESTPRDEFYPALYVQDNKPEVFRKNNRCIQNIDLKEFPHKDRAQELVPLVEMYSFRKWTTSIMDGINNYDHQLVIGPKGCGKTSAIMQLAARIGQPVIRINFTAQVSISDLVGSVGFGKRPDGSIGTIWNDGPLPTAMRNGYWLLLDEIDYGDPSVLSLLYPVLEEFNPSKGKLPKLTLKEKDGEIITARPTFRIFATGNSIGGDTNGEYVGTSAMNPALVDRFSGHGQVLRIPQVQVKEEREILREVVPNMSDNYVRKAAEFAAKMRANEIRNFSTRVLINFCHKMLLLKNAVDAAQVTFLPLIEDEPTRKAVEAAVLTKFGKTVRVANMGGDGGDEGPSVVGGVEVTPERAKAIYDSHKGGMSFEKLEVHYGLPINRGKSAWRICKDYEAALKKAAKAEGKEEPKAEDAEASTEGEGEAQETPKKPSIRVKAKKAKDAEVEAEAKE